MMTHCRHSSGTTCSIEGRPLTGGMPAAGFIKFLNDVIDGQKATPKQ